ncbi:MAG: carboxymuconolactone decarboxylase family protein [Acidimicrobiia bacterium]|nr:carboxymuconolactone decarboxylase family protein [Acidimicrobiia bacterium]
MEGPRLAPKPESEWDDETRGLLARNAVGEGQVLNIFATLAHHPKLLKRWMVFGAHVLAKSTLPARDRELLILRAGWRCRSAYEWGQHVVIARRTGISDEEIARVALGADAAGWDPFDATLLRAADELHDDSTLSDATWDSLGDRYDDQQRLDVIFAVGQYQLVSMALNALRVERDDGIADDPIVPFPTRD